MDSGVKKELFKGVYYTAIAKYAGIVVSLVVVAVLARLISPEEFGVVAVATILMQFLSTFGNLGIGPAIIQFKKLTDTDIEHIFSFTVLIAAGISLVFFIGSGYVADYYKNDQLLIICQILTINLFFSVINSIPNSLLYRDKEFKFMTYRTLSVQLAGGVISVVAAFAGFGIYSLVINPVFSSITLFVINFIKYPQKLHLKIDYNPIKIIFSYSSYLFMFDMINYLSRNLDKLIIGKYLNMSALGFYEKSYRLMMLPLQNINHVIGPVIHPVFSDLQHDMSKLSMSYEKIIRLLSFIGFPLTALLFFTSNELVLIFFGDNWVLSVPSFKILSISVGFQILMSTSGAIFQSSNATKYMMLSGILSSMLTVLAMFAAILYFKTIEAVAWSITVTFIINFFQAFFLLYIRVLKRKLHYFFGEMLSPVALTFAIVVVNLIMIQIITIDNLLISLFIKSTVSLVVFLVYIQSSGEFNIYHKIKLYLNK